MRWLHFCALVALPIFASGQVPDEVRAQLIRTPVANHDGFMYASAVGSMRGSRENSEEFLASRAIRSLAYALCSYQPKVGRALEVSITQLTMVSSLVQEKRLEVIMRAPLQNPDCQIRATGISVPQSNQPISMSEQESASKSEPDLRLMNPGYTRSGGITTRIFNGDY